MQQTAYARIVSERQRKVDVGATTRKARTLVDILKEAVRYLVVFLFNQVGVCVLLISYNVIGAFSFRALEGVHGDGTVENMAFSAKNETIDILWNLTLHLNVLEEHLWRRGAEDAVLEYQKTLVPLIRRKNYRGVRPIDAWTIPGGLMYSLSIYTTIGYGNLTPRTDAGKIATIFYALLGMPLMLLYMSNLGEILGNVFKFIYFSICSCGLNGLSSKRATDLRRASRKKSLHNEDNQFRKTVNVPKEVEQKERKETIPIFWCLFVISVYVFCGGMLFAHWEGWSSLDGCYFCYISLSTVGFGDLVPGRVLTDDDGDATDVETVQILATVYLLVGMALVAMCFNLMQEEALENLKTFWRSLGCLRSKRVSRAVVKAARRSGGWVMDEVVGVAEGGMGGKFIRELGLGKYYSRGKEIAMELQPIDKIRQMTSRISRRENAVENTYL